MIITIKYYVVLGTQSAYFSDRPWQISMGLFLWLAWSYMPISPIINTALTRPHSLTSLKGYMEFLDRFHV